MIYELRQVLAPCGGYQQRAAQLNLDGSAVVTMSLLRLHIVLEDCSPSCG